MDDIKKGDIVRLKSGGPAMTVQEVGDYGYISDGARCVWFDGKTRLQEVFDRATLEKDDDCGGHAELL